MAEADTEIADNRANAEKRETIRAALRRSDPQMVFQPICRLVDGRVTAVEALSRFASEPLRPPDVWFSDAADVGLADELELLAVRKAISEAADLAPHLSLNLNVSPSVVMQAPLLDTLRGFDPRRIILEITEHTMIKDYDALTGALAPLRERGIRIAIDDAGAGYASLRHVIMLRPDIIKFDISITRGVDTDPMRRALAAALGEFGRHTSTEIVAEGVESASEVEVLRSVGISKGQGYYFSHPKPASAFAAGTADVAA